MSSAQEADVPYEPPVMKLKNVNPRKDKFDLTQREMSQFKSEEVVNRCPDVDLKAEECERCSPSGECVLYVWLGEPVSGSELNCRA